MSDLYDGFYGPWVVTGMLTEKTVYASSAQEAIERSGIEEWENPTAIYARGS